MGWLHTRQRQYGHLQFVSFFSTISPHQVKGVIVGKLLPVLDFTGDLGLYEQYRFVLHATRALLNFRA